MTRLRSIPNRLQAAPKREMGSINVSERRITGTTLRNRRLKMWAKDPHCAMCGRLVDYPGGFELDHIVPLYKGGPDTEHNCQVLCVEYDLQGNKQGCHVAKTLEDIKQ